VFKLFEERRVIEHFRQGTGGAPANTDIRAAEYVRMSTEHQKYSTENQSDAIRKFADRRGIQIVRTYADAGKSGLKLEGRDALKALIADVETGRADFSPIIVYDVSRWGRFQDADEGAHYEYLCKRAGITVQYCAEQFENDGSPVSAIVKGVKRAMAGEHSRELSAKVFSGQRRLIELGYAYFLLQKNNSNWWEPGAISVRPGLGASKSSPDYFRVHIDRMSGRQGTKG
jgi:nitroimidazol reductase NimA-like FMN-containing flavoprotein (pyridoxamine 5'-phosphate oxidase superfamily)